MSNRPERDWNLLCGELEERGLAVMRDHQLARYTTYGVGGAARVAVRVAVATDVEAVGAVMSGHRDVPCLVVGRGSNLLVNDEGFEGVALVPATGGGAEDVECDGDLVVAPATLPMPVLARRSAALGRGGLEWAVGIPGSVGGAVRMNGGCHGSDMSEAVVDADIVSLRSGQRVRVAAEHLGFHFRGSVLAAHHVVVSVRLRSVDGDPVSSAERIAAIVSWRRENQPGGRNAGSVFVNPGDGALAAGSLVDGCGLKGLRHGAAEVSEKHANFIQAHDGATATDIAALMEQVQRIVEESHGVRLRSEIRLVGFPAETERRFADERHLEPGWRDKAARLCAILGEGPA